MGINLPQREGLQCNMSDGVVAALLGEYPPTYLPLAEAFSRWFYAAMRMRWCLALRPLEPWN